MILTYGNDMPTSRLTSKGQTTIPKEIREKLDLKPGDRIQFSIEDDNRVVLRAQNKSLAALAGMFYDPKRKPVSIKEMNEVMAKAIADHVMGEQ